ncbi:unnamed protein product [Lactuca virosa]|uniref:Uncharacterized protein n=1 Tax=Lactuca virosa TaxID=75947 RepID=A0AAU9P5D6_9ASTR|nr:unnamed protein product [Lactuca virosa]
MARSRRVIHSYAAYALTNYAPLKFKIVVIKCVLNAHSHYAATTHNKPNLTTLSLPAPICPFFRSNIARLTVVKVKVNTADQELDLYSSPKQRKSRKSQNLSEGSSSFRSLSVVPSFGKIVGRGLGQVSVDNEIDKP